MIDEFKNGDIVIEIEDDRKFVVEDVLEDAYIVRSMSHPSSRVGYAKDYARYLFVRVGKWDSKLCKEVDE